MGVVRTWIFPILRIIIFLVIAVALVKIAFFAVPPAGDDDTGEVPTGEIVEPQVAAALGTVRNDVSVTATVSADPAVPVKGTLAGDVLKVLVTPGQSVAADTDVMSIRSVTPGPVSPEGVPGADVVKTVTVDAGAVGVISAVPVIAGQTVAVGDVVAQVAPNSFTVSGSLLPEQQYRLLAMPTEAQVTITGGPAPFTCTGVKITSALAGASGDAADPTVPTAGSGATVSCPVPTGVTVFAGLAAEMTLSAGVAENVLVVPVTAVEGLSGTGNVYVTDDAGATETRAVTLGLTDGVNVEVKDGLVEGEMILQFVPGASQDEGGGVDIGDGCQTFPDGSVVCG